MNKSRRVLSLSILNLAGFLGIVVANALAIALSLNSRTAGELFDLYPNIFYPSLFTPAGLTAAFWRLIYIVFLAIFVVYPLIPSVRKDAQRVHFIQRMGLLFFISCLVNIGWTFAWHYEIVPLSLVLMLILLGCLIAIYLRLNIGKSEATKAEKYAGHRAFSFYLGWITIATIANVTALLVDINWNAWGLSEQFWAVAVSIVGIVIALSVLFTRKDTYYPFVVMWALLGRMAERTPVTTVPDHIVLVVAFVGMVLISGCVIAQLIAQLIRKQVVY